MSDPNDSKPKCDHGVVFDLEEANRILDEAEAKGSHGNREIRKRFPRLHGVCPKGCGFNGIAYASTAHYTYGDW